MKLYDLQEVSESISRRSSNDQMDIDINDLRKELEEAASIYAQADILHHLYVKRFVPTVLFSLFLFFVVVEYHCLIFQCASLTKI